MEMTSHCKIRHNPSVFPILIKFAVIILMVTISSGCAFKRYKLAKKDTPPPVEMNLNFKQPPIELLLNSVIIFKGPGSWKREAYWDEYIVSITNHGTLPLSIESAAIVDFQDKINSAGIDPWELEKLSKAWWKGIRASGAGTAVALGAGTGISALVISASWGTVLGAGSASGVAIGAAGVIAMPVIGVSYIVGNIRGRNKIEKEFNRRRLVLPVIIPAGQSVQGSLFFPITPGPKYLILKCRMGEDIYDVEFDLSPLKALHIKFER